MKKLFLTASLILGIAFSNAQVQTPDASPAAKVSQVVGLTDIQVEYARPSVKERKIFGDLVPMSKIWRTGANAPTTIQFSTPVIFAGQKVKEGKYAIYTIPHDEYWEVFLYTKTDGWGSPEKLDESLVAVTSKVESKRTKDMVETFLISFTDLTNTTANLNLAWQDRSVAIPIEVDPHEMVMNSIKKTMESGKATAGDYFSAASYFHENNLNPELALEYVNKAADMNPDAYWVATTQAEIQAANKDLESAIKSAQRAAELSEKAKSEFYVNRNKENLKKWSKK